MKSADVQNGELEGQARDKGRRTGNNSGPSADLVRVYLNGIGKTALLSVKEEMELSRRIEAGVCAKYLLQTNAKITRAKERDVKILVKEDKVACTHLLEASLRLMVSLTKRYTNRGMPLLGLIQEGNLGLIHVIEKFDYTKDFKFSTYIAWWICQAITRGTTDQSHTIHFPVHLVEQINKTSRIKCEFYQQLDREATNEELTEELGIPGTKIEMLLRQSHDPVSSDMPVGTDKEVPLENFIENSEVTDAEEAAIASLRHRGVCKALSTPETREREVIKLHYDLDDGLPRTLDQIGCHFGLPHERARQIEREVMPKPRGGDHADKLYEYAG